MKSSRFPTWQGYCWPHLHPRLVLVGLLWSAALAAQFPTANPAYQSGFPVTLNGEPVQSGGAALGDLDGDGRLDVVVGARDGKVHAYSGFGVKLWEYDTGDMGIAGKAAIGDIDGDSWNEVVIGAADVADQSSADGGLYVISHDGQLQCAFTTEEFFGNGFAAGVYSSPALADLDGNDGGKLEIAFGSWDTHVRAIHDDCTVLWDVVQIPPPPALATIFFDTIFSSPAIADINGDQQLDVLIGTDSRDSAPNVVPVGGAMMAFDGATGALLPGFPTTDTDDVMWSSPSLGDLNGDGLLEIAAGMGYCWENPACSVPPAGVQPVAEGLFAWTTTGVLLPGWPFDLSTAGNLGQGTYAKSTPALADVDGDGALEVVINTIEPGDANGGQLYVINGDGSLVSGWPVRPVLPADCSGNTVSFSTGRSPVVADISGDDRLEVILPSNWDLVVFDHQGTQLSRSSCASGPYSLRGNGPMAGAAVGDLDGDGDLEVVAGGVATLAPAVGAIYAWDFPGLDGPDATPWPVMRRTADNRAVVTAEAIFADGFESGDTSRW